SRSKFNRGMAEFPLLSQLAAEGRHFGLPCLGQVFIRPSVGPINLLLHCRRIALYERDRIAVGTHWRGFEFLRQRLLNYLVGLIEPIERDEGQRQVTSRNNPVWVKANTFAACFGCFLELAY